jgi:hypothetical protein
LKLLGQRSQVPIVDAAAVEVVDQLSERRDPPGSVATDGHLGTVALHHLDGLNDDLDSVSLRGERAALLPGPMTAGITAVLRKPTCAQQWKGPPAPGTGDRLT